MTIATRLRCHACGETSTSPEFPFRCRNAGQGDDDHLLRRELDLDPSLAAAFDDDEPNPFVRFRKFFHSYHVAAQAGMHDASWVAHVSELSEAVRRVDRRVFRQTPFVPVDAVSTPQVWAKDESDHVAGSHKARHLMGVLIWLTLLERLHRLPVRPRLAVASCGNAAVAAATLARAVDWPLDVFVPPEADPVVLHRLQELGAHLTPCPRDDDRPGDPCFHRFGDAVAAGAIPFTCQGSENGLTVEGGMTMGYELAAQGRASRVALDRLFIQVGGGALASAVWQGLEEAHALGVIDAMPRLYVVQTEGGAPLARAVRRLKGRDDSLEAGLKYALHHRSEFMWPWESTPTSLATGILDDETYDWFAVARATLTSGGDAVVAGESSVQAAHALVVRSLQPLASATGTAGLAGALHLGGFRDEEKIGILITGSEHSLEE